MVEFTGWARKVFHATASLMAHLCAVEICGPNFLSDEISELLSRQRYDLSKVPTAYLVAIEFTNGNGPARIVVDDPAFTDLSELHESNPIDYLVIYRTDSKKLTRSDIATIKISACESVVDESQITIENADDHSVIHFES